MSACAAHSRPASSRRKASAGPLHQAAAFVAMMHGLEVLQEAGGGGRRDKLLIKGATFTWLFSGFLTSFPPSLVRSGPVTPVAVLSGTHELRLDLAGHDCAGDLLAD